MNETLDDDMNTQQETVRDFIDRNDSDALIAYLKKLSNDDLLSFSFGSSHRTSKHLI